MELSSCGVGWRPLCRTEISLGQVTEAAGIMARIFKAVWELSNLLLSALREVWEPNSHSPSGNPPPEDVSSPCCYSRGAMKQTKGRVKVLRERGRRQDKPMALQCRACSESVKHGLLSTQGSSEILKICLFF